jgi:hypothetical protein
MIGMKRLQALVVLLGMCGFAGSSLAAGAVTDLVTAIRVDSTGKGLVQFATAVVGAATCCTGTICNTNTTSLAFDTNTAGGKAILTLVTSAKLSNKKVQAAGSGTCNVYPSGPSLAEDFSVGTLLP